MMLAPFEPQLRSDYFFNEENQQTTASILTSDLSDVDVVFDGDGDADICTSGRAVTAPATRAETQQHLLAAAHGHINDSNVPYHLCVPGSAAAAAGADLSRSMSGQDGAIEYVGPFILGPELGRGCTGIVRLGTHKYTGFEVAFKIIQKKKLNNDPKQWKKVKCEIVILKLIDHPHVLKIFDVLETENRLYLVLEHVKGGELFDYIVSKGRVEREEALRLTAQIVMGLQACHQHHICHRDLKPENLLLDENLNIKIADFGMARLMKNDSISKTSCGSPHYASPEIIEGGTYDAKCTDVWSIGVILYALITGSLPFDHDNIPTLLSMVTKGVYSTPSFVPSDIAHLISRMLTVDPKKRIKLDEIQNHPCYRGTKYFNNERRQLEQQIKTDEYSKENYNNSNYNDVNVTNEYAKQDIDSVDDSVLNDLESLGLGWGTREELKRKISSKQNEKEPSLEQVFYQLLKQRRTRRLQELSMLSPKVVPSRRQHGASVPVTPSTHAFEYANLFTEHAASQPTSQSTSTATSPLPMQLPDGFLNEFQLPPAHQTTQPQTCTQTGKHIFHNDEYNSTYTTTPSFNDSSFDTSHLPAVSRDRPASNVSVHPEYGSASEYYMLVSQQAPPPLQLSLSLPSSPGLLPNVNSDGNVSGTCTEHVEHGFSVPTTPTTYVRASPFDMEYIDSDSSTVSTPLQTGLTSSFQPPIQTFSRAATVPTPSTTRPRSNSQPTAHCARQLFNAPTDAIHETIHEHDEPTTPLPIHSKDDSEIRRTRQEAVEKKEHSNDNEQSKKHIRFDIPPVDVAKTHSPTPSSLPPGYIQSPRFHRIRLTSTPASQNTASTGSPRKKSWFSSIFARRPSLNVLGNKLQTLRRQESNDKHSVNALYSQRSTLTIANDIRAVLKAEQIPFKTKKGYVFEVEWPLPVTNTTDVDSTSRTPSSATKSIFNPLAFPSTPTSTITVAATAVRTVPTTSSSATNSPILSPAVSRSQINNEDLLATAPPAFNRIRSVPTPNAQSPSPSPSSSASPSTSPSLSTMNSYSFPHPNEQHSSNGSISSLNVTVPDRRHAVNVSGSSVSGIAKSPIFRPRNSGTSTSTPSSRHHSHHAHKHHRSHSSSTSKTSIHQRALSFLPRSLFSPPSSNTSMSKKTSPKNTSNIVKFTIEICQLQNADVRSVTFRHRAGDVAEYLQLQQQIQSRLNLEHE